MSLGTFYACLSLQAFQALHQLVGGFSPPDTILDLYLWLVSFHDHL